MSKYLFGASYNPPDIPDLNWAVLESVSALTFIEPQRIVLTKTLHRYLVNRVEYQATSSMKNVQRRLTQIHTHATALKDLVSLHPTDESSIDEESNLLQAVFGQFPIWMDRRTLAHDLTTLIRNTEETLKNLRTVSQRGRPRQEGLRVLIRAWHKVYRDAGGTGIGCSWFEDEKEFKGPFLDLLHGALTQAGGELPASKSALGQMIRETIRSR